MSTAGRINKSGPRFVPKRKNPPASSSRPSREGSVASSTAGPTPKPPPVSLPPLGEDPIEEEREPTQTGTTPATLGSTAPATATVGTSFRPGASFFAPSDPTAASSSQASTSNALGFHPSSSAPFSTGNSGYTATQATSFGTPTQPPSGSKSPQRTGSLFLPDPETSPRPASAAAPSSSSPTRGTAFAVSNVPPTQLSPSRRAAELQPERPASPPPPPPVAASGGLPRKRKAQPANDAGEEEGSGAEAGSPRAKGKGKGKEKASGDEPPAKRAASTAGKKRRAAASADSDAETEDAYSDEGVTKPRAPAKGATAKPATSKTRPKLRRPASRRTAVEAEEAEAVASPAIVSTAQAGDAAEEMSSEEDRVQPKKRVRKRKPAKKGAVDRFLFGGSGDEEDEDAPGGDIAVGDAEGSADDGDEQPKKKKRSAPKKTVKKGKAAQKGKKAASGDAAEEGQDGAGEGNSDADVDEDGDGASPRAESPEALPPVEPDETTMAVLADPRPKVSIGRPSQRTIFFEEREQRVKAERKKLLKLKRERMKRIKKGLPVTDDENEGDQTPAAANNRNGDGAAGSDAEGGGEDLPVNNADDEDAGGVDQRFRLPSLGADEDEDDAAAENGGPFSGLAAINAAMAARGENDGDSDGEGGGNGDDDEEDDAGFQETEWAPQMRIVDGQLVLDESSLQVERGGNTQQIINREVVEESAQDRFVNSSTYSKRKGGARWSKEETEMFYDAISQFYTNFEMIALLFPHRTRHEIRRKFNREDKLNPKLITAALARRKRVDIEAIAKITGADLSGPVPEDPMDEVNRRRAEIEANGGVAPEQQGGRKRKGKGKKEEGGEHDDDAAVLGAGRKRKGKKGAAGAAVGFMPGEEDEDAAEDGEEEDEDGEEEDEELVQIRLEMEEEARQRRIDEMEAAGAGA